MTPLGHRAPGNFQPDLAYLGPAIKVPRLAGAWGRIR